MFERERRGSERNIKKYKSCQDLLITGVPAQLEKVEIEMQRGGSNIKGSLAHVSVSMTTRLTGRGRGEV